jgi:hypothetical protein
MKYILFSLLLGIGLIIPQNSFAQISPQNTACSAKKNGDACTFTTSVQSGRGGTSSGGTQSGFCDRANGNDTAANNPLTCKTGQNDWADCTVAGDACKSGNDLGTCKITPPTSPRGSATRTCDTNQKPPGNPGGSTGGGTSPGGATADTCDGKTCTSGQVCATQGGKPTCTKDASVNGKCDGKTCTSGQVCATQGGKPTCTASTATPGSTGGGGTTDSSAPQSVGFTNPIKFNSIPDLIAGIINALLGILGAITVAILVMSGFKYMTSSNPGEVGQALDGIRNAVVGLMIIMGAFLITQYIISALV